MEASQRSACARTEEKRNVFQRSPLNTHETRIQKEFMCCSRLWYNGSQAEEEVAAELLARPDKGQFSRSDAVTGSQPPSCWIYDAVGTQFKREKHLHPVSFFPPQLIFLIHDVFCHERQTAWTSCTTNLQTRLKKNHSPDPEELLGSVFFFVVVFLLYVMSFMARQSELSKQQISPQNTQQSPARAASPKAGMQFDSVGLELSTLLDTKPIKDQNKWI